MLRGSTFKCLCNDIYKMSTHNFPIENFFFSFQQFLFHLSQISPRRNNITLKHTKQKKNSNLTNNETVLSNSNVDELCASFNETLRNLKSSPHVDILDIPVHTVLSKKLPYILKNYDNLFKYDKTWKVSYISAESFAKNRGEPSLSITNNNLPDLIRSLCQQTKLGYRIDFNL